MKATSLQTFVQNNAVTTWQVDNPAGTFFVVSNREGPENWFQHALFYLAAFLLRHARL